MPAFLIATVDKFAGLPFIDKVGAFFDHVDREHEHGFYGAAEPGVGRRLFGGARLLPPSVIIQDELRLISGPLGTVAALYEVALDRLASRPQGDRMVRPKIVASTATVRRADTQITALFDRSRTAIFPPPGPDRLGSFFALTVPAAQSPGRLYVGLAAPCKGPKLLFLRALTTLLAAGARDMPLGDAADPYLTALCYFNALRELGGARRIVEDEVRAKLADYGTRRRRLDPEDQPFENRTLREVLELTSRESTDRVADAKEALARSVFAPNGVDVALATNMISVGLDIGRLGLMVVQGQPKAAAEYIQATSRVGRLPGSSSPFRRAAAKRPMMDYTSGWWSMTRRRYARP
ncbi:MAG: helicase-related protein [Hyphomicrobiaceae bacterium]